MSNVELPEAVALVEDAASLASSFCFFRCRVTGRSESPVTVDKTEVLRELLAECEPRLDDARERVIRGRRFLIVCGTGKSAMEVTSCIDAGDWREVVDEDVSPFLFGFVRDFEIGRAHV